MSYRCPVCFYPELSQPPSDWFICPCCGTEFENDDSEKTHDQLRFDWWSTGTKWFSQATKPPANWSPFEQVFGQQMNSTAGVGGTVADMKAKMYHAPKLENIGSISTATSGTEQTSAAA